MEDENKLTFQNRNLPTKSYDFFKTLRNNNEFCDVILRVGNKAISAHRLIIAAAIPYFQKSFFSSKVSESEENEVQLPDVEPSAFENLLDYAYTCKLVITTENVKNLLYGAHRLQVEDVREACCNFLIDRLHPENVWNVQNFANDLKSTVLLENTDIYVREHFVDISKTEEFLNLSFEYVNQLLGRDDLHVPSEEQVFETMMKWVKKCPEQRKAYLPELLKLVRMSFLSPLYLKKHVVKEDLLRGSLPCRDLLDQARDFHDFPEERSACSFSTVPRCYSKSSSNSEAVNEERIYVVYGNQMFTAKCLENAKTVWKQKGITSFRYVGASSAVVSDKLYLSRGCDLFSYCPISNTLNFCASMPFGRTFAGAAELCGKMYVCGGSDDFMALDIVECYDPKTDKWEKIANLRERREQPGVATLGKHIYVSGGFNDRVQNSVEKYDARDGRWRYVQPMQCERYGHSSTALNGQLYACGGLTSDLKCTTSAEVFDPGRNEWSFIKPMNSAKFYFKLLPYCGELYAIGGLDDQDKLLETVEIYDPKTEEWRFGDAIDSVSFVSAEVIMSSPTDLEKRTLGTQHI